MSEKKLRTFKISDRLYEVLQALGEGNATRGLKEAEHLAKEWLEAEYTDEMLKMHYPLYYAKYYLNGGKK